MTPPEPQKENNESDDRSRSYNRIKAKYSPQKTSSTHNSPYYDSYSYGVKDYAVKDAYPYGYGEKEYETPLVEREAGYIQSEYYPSIRQTGSGWGCEPSYQSPPQSLR